MKRKTPAPVAADDEMSGVVRGQAPLRAPIHPDTSGWCGRAVTVTVAPGPIIIDLVNAVTARPDSNRPVRSDCRQRPAGDGPSRMAEDQLAVKGQHGLTRLVRGLLTGNMEGTFLAVIATTAHH